MASEWLKCRNWEFWQTYRRDRSAPPWIKVHRRILQDLEWSQLSDAEKGQLVSIWILAADRDGFVRNDPQLLQRVLGLDDPPNIQKFMDLHFLTSEWRHDDANTTPFGSQSDA